MIQINREKSVMFLYTNNKLSEKERNQSHLQEHQKKYLGINLTLQVKISTLKTMRD